MNEKHHRLSFQRPQISVSRLSQFQQEFKGIRHSSITRSKHDATSAFLCFLCTSEFISFWDLYQATPTLLISNFLIRFGVHPWLKKQSTYKLKRIRTVRQASESLDPFQTFPSLPKNLIVLLDPGWIQQINVKFGKETLISIKLTNGSITRLLIRWDAKIWIAFFTFFEQKSMYLLLLCDAVFSGELKRLLLRH